MPIIEARNLAKDYNLGKTVTHAVKGSTCGSSRRNSSPLPTSGSGKTTLLNLLGCIEVPSSGTLQMDGREDPPVRGPACRHPARQAGFVFQTFNLIPVLTASKTWSTRS